MDDSCCVIMPIEVMTKMCTSNRLRPWVSMDEIRSRTNEVDLAMPICLTVFLSVFMIILEEVSNLIQIIYAEICFPNLDMGFKNYQYSNTASGTSRQK